LLIYCGVVLVAFIAGIWICGRTSAQLGVHDPGGIVWDEFVGLWITLIAVPGGWYGVVSGFVLFRLLDILKPWPIKWVDKRVEGGLGIMLDDVLAGIIASMCLHGSSLLLM
jgi:phosphatidylglycerophosphatase A